MHYFLILQFEFGRLVHTYNNFIGKHIFIIKAQPKRACVTTVAAVKYDQNPECIAYFHRHVYHPCMLILVSVWLIWAVGLPFFTQPFFLRLGQLKNKNTMPQVV